MRPSNSFQLRVLPAALACAACTSAPPSAAFTIPSPAPPTASAQDASAQASSTSSSDAEELAKKLSNPVAAMISIPFQLNYDQNIGPGEKGERWQMNFQPVVPFTLNEDWNVISRTILPLISQTDIPPGEDEAGIGDTAQSLFFSPKQPTAGGLIWGAGPVFLLPTASDETLGSEKWGLGPTVVLLKQEGANTLGLLANHIWSFAGDDDRAEVNSTFLQPFLAYTTKAAWTFTLNSESTYDWRENEWAIPVNGIVSKLEHCGKLPVSLGAGVRYWLEDSESSPEGVGVRFIVTILLPK